MILGIDIDDTIVDTSKKANEIFHQNKEYQNLNDYHELPEEIFNAFISKYINVIVETEEIKDDVIDILLELKNLGIKILFITARGGTFINSVMPRTNLYFEKKKIPYSEIIFSQTLKGQCAKKYNVDIFIDDKELVLDEIKKQGIKTLKFSSNKENSNHECVSNWQEIKDYIKNYLGVKNNG